MKCRKNVRKLIEAFNAAADPSNTELARFRDAVVALKAAPSELAPPHAQASRYDDFVYIHEQSMAGHPPADPGPHPGHKGPLFFPWHREFLRQFENALRGVAGDPSICLPYWDFSRDQAPADPGYPFIDDFLGGDGTGAGDAVETGPFAFANGWTLTLGSSDRLQRNFGGSTPSLPTSAAVTGALAESTYDSPSYDWNVAGADSFRNLVEGWVGPQGGPNMHNRVHVWIGGSMLPATSPNDPVFFLNHAKEDELWAVWMQKYPAVPHYLPNDGYAIPAGQHHLKRLSDTMESLGEYFGAGTLERPIDLLDHKAITWYDTDLPDVTLESGPAVAFNDTPAGLTVAKHIRFRVQSCRPVYFTITGAPTGNFSLVGGPDFPVTPQEANDFEILEIEVRFLGVGPDVQVSAVDIQAYVIDEEGYYAAAPNDPYVFETYHIELVANDIVTSDSSIVLVLDRSGSMASPANSGFTRSELLKSAVGVVHELMKDSDEIGIARFDHEADVLLPMTLKSAGLGTTLTGPGLDPRGATSIGGGILVGSGLINGPTATHPNKAMIVLTDGNENYDPLIAALPAGTINQTTFAIGFGLPGDVSDPVLDQISANTGGYLLVTGDMTDDDERFTLAKFFIQILKDATLNQLVLDPAGQLLWNGVQQEIPFQVADSDVSVDVVVLNPIPFALDFRLITPAGKEITPAMSGVEPNVRYRVGEDVAYYRLMLPALPGDPGGSHRGTWRAVLRLATPDVILGGAQTHVAGESVVFRERLRRLREFVAKPAPFNMSVHAYSNLTMHANLRQDGYAPGDTMHLTASLREYQVPLESTATVWADVVQPDGSGATLAFARWVDGHYHADWPTSLPGAYRFTVRAEGQTRSNARFTRSKVVTGGVWAGGDQPYDPKTVGGDGHGGGGDDGYCRTLLCLIRQVLKSPRLIERFKGLGIDLDELLRCLEAQCGRKAPPHEGPQRAGAPAPDWQAMIATPEAGRLIGTLLSSGLSSLQPLEAAPTRPVKRTPKREVGDENMFVRPDEPGSGDGGKPDGDQPDGDAQR
ncbi:MAG: tyrosinase family protein [Aromatoleum sp.]|jgi:hypothetical protein|uniref:tyrosinase family protein n=1 Tax=Aromatoleum sp. TaxID=2307007 RepID=UPI002893DE39|nr:tyrosinase family protein [Aromatoleum sp.]MDT3671468.1 tyrosinase family protein [Aromatoleum sp.]